MEARKQLDSWVMCLGPLMGSRLGEEVSERFNEIRSNSQQFPNTCLISWEGCDYVGNGSCLFFPPPHPKCLPEMSVRMSNLDNERDERDEDSHEDRGISEYRQHQEAKFVRVKHHDFEGSQAFRSPSEATPPKQATSWLALAIGSAFW